MDEELFARLHTAACEAMSHAYAPYSHFPVGAAILADDGEIYSGCNVENAAFLAGLCAECGALGDMIRAGATKIRAFMAVDSRKEVVVPCGRCRQMLSEFTDPGTPFAMPHGVRPFKEVLPYTFTPDDLAAGASTTHAQER